MIKRALDITSSVLASQIRGWRGTMAFKSKTKQPEKLLQLYEFEACPYCRLVRETLCELDLDALIYPCPRGGQRFRNTAVEIGGKAQFPLLVDENTDTVLYESADIVRYLRATYGVGSAAKARSGRVAIPTSYLATASRALRGMKSDCLGGPGQFLQQPLELYSFESSPFSRLVRERLCELEIPYILRNTPKAMWEDMGPSWVKAKGFPNSPVEGRNRIVLKERSGQIQVPYLVDPNTNVEMFESDEIIQYLNQTYAAQ